MDRERAVIIKLFSKGKRPGEILKMLQICKSRSEIVYRNIQRYNKTGDINDMPRNGRPKSVRTLRLKKIVMNRIDPLLKITSSIHYSKLLKITITQNRCKT